jgi:uncharacterized protein (TIGR03437 family)
MRIRTCCGAGVMMSLWLALPPPAVSQSTVTFDFDSGSPVVSPGQSIPIDQSWGGLTAHFSSPSGAAFSVQNAARTGFSLSKFSGNYLYDNDLRRNVLTITFSQPLASISLAFATADFGVEVPTTLQLTAYMDSSGTPAVGSATAHGSYAGDTMPMGTLSFDSGGRPFNIVEIVPLPQSQGASVFLADNIKATTFSALPIAFFSSANYGNVAPLAANSIATGAGQGLAPGVQPEAAPSPALSTMLANTTVSLTDSLGVQRPAPLYYVGPSQINFVVPDGTALGSSMITVTSGVQVTATGIVQIDLVAPGIFTANADGKGTPAAWAISVAPDQTQTFHGVASCGTAPGSCVPAPIDLGPAGTFVILSLYGTGIRGRSSLTAVTANIGGVNAEVQYAGLQPTYEALDQVNILIPRALAGRGEVDVILTVDGRQANTVRINIL